MQKKHLQLLLLLLLAGCSKPQFSELNPYFQKNNTLNIEYGEFHEIRMFWEGYELQLQGDEEAPEFRFGANGYAAGSLMLQWQAGDKHSLETVSLTSPATGRTLSSLWMRDSLTGYEEFLEGLPGGEGVASYFEGETTRDIGVTIKFPTSLQADSLFVRRSENEDKYFRCTRKDGFTILFFAPDGFARPELATESGMTRGLTTRFRKPDHYGLMVIFAASPDAAKKVAQKYAEHDREDIEKSSRTSLADTLAFSIQTGDDRVNRATALLSAQLCGAEDNLSFGTRAEIETNSESAAGLFLSSRELPTLVYMNAKESKFSLAQRVAFGWPAYRAAISYGMGQSEQVRALAGDVVGSFSEENAASLLMGELPPHAGEQDSVALSMLMHVNAAGYLACGEEIARSRGDNASGDLLRKGELDRQRMIRRSWREWLNLRKEERQKQNTAKPDTAKQKHADVSLTTQSTLEAPDDSAQIVERMIRLCARNGFNWMEEDPARVIARTPIDHFTWLKWVAFRYQKELKIGDTPDLDSLITMLLDAPSPALLTAADSEGVQTADWLSLSAALQSLAETYVGVHPDWLRHEVRITPHIPANWGHTAARVPYGEGFLHLDYDFVHDKARVGISELADEHTVVFAYPIPTGGSLVTQFKLSKDRPKVEITFVRKQQGMTELRVEDVN